MLLLGCPPSSKALRELLQLCSLSLLLLLLLLLMLMRRRVRQRRLFRMLLDWVPLQLQVVPRPQAARAPSSAVEPADAHQAARSGADSKASIHSLSCEHVPAQVQTAAVTVLEGGHA